MPMLRLPFLQLSLALLAALSVYGWASEQAIGARLVNAVRPAPVVSAWNGSCDAGGCSATARIRSSTGGPISARFDFEIAGSVVASCSTTAVAVPGQTVEVGCDAPADLERFVGQEFTIPAPVITSAA